MIQSKDSVTISRDSLQALTSTEWRVPEGVDTIVVVIGAMALMLVGLRFVATRMREKGQGFGPNSLKALGLVLFLPTLVLVSAMNSSLRGEALAALLGTIAGYVLSHSRTEDS